LQESQPVQLMIGGRGPLKGALQQQVSDLGIVDQVVFLDYISDDELPAYYTVADVCVSPSIIDLQGDTEGLGIVLLEALACETPCVASRVGGIVDIVQDGMNGLLVEPKNSADLADKIQWLINNDRLRQEMGTQGRLFVKEHFSWQVKAHEILTVYQAILGKKR
jgi:glycosyltransferase involved in cell wall biosynthesis